MTSKDRTNGFEMVCQFSYKLHLFTVVQSIPSALAHWHTYDVYCDVLPTYEMLNFYDQTHCGNLRKNQQ